MASDEQLKQVINAATNALKELWPTNPEDVAREGDLGKDLTFRPAVPYARRVVDLFKPLQGCDLSQVGYQGLVQVQVQAESAADILRRMKSFSPSKTQNAGGERQNLINQIRDNFDAYYQNVAPVVAFLSSRDQTLESKRAQFEQQLTAIVEARARADDSIKKISEILEASREASAQVGVSQQSACFRDQANLHKSSARNWLAAGGAAAIAAALWGWHAFSGISSPPSGDSTTLYYIHVRTTAGYRAFASVLRSFLVCKELHRPQTQRGNKSPPAERPPNVRNVCAGYKRSPD